MPGLTIHIAVANEYMRKFTDEIRSKDDFIEGVIAPDFFEDRYESHYHNYGEVCSGLNYLLENCNFDIDSDYGKGYFLHVLTDYIFYNYNFKKEVYYVRAHNLRTFYHDYDCTNKFLIEKYNINNIPEKAKKWTGYLDEEPVFLKIDKLTKFIDFVSSIKISEQIKNIKKMGEPIVEERIMNLEVNLCGIKMKNPVTVASGTFGYGREYAEYIDLNKLGGIITKGTSLKPRPGNKPPRIAEVPGGMLNSIGLQNPGVEYFAKFDLPWLRSFDTKVIVNACGSTIEDYVELCKILNTLDIDGVELNLSCPNVKAGCLAFGTSYEGVKDVTSQVRKVLTDKPLIVKLTPNVTDITQPAKGAEDAGADGISGINTLLGMKIDIEKRRPVLANNTGGYSGPGIKSVGVRCVYQMAQAVNIPVLGMGGIMNGDDAIEYMMAGATAVSIGAGNFIDPETSINTIEGIKSYMKKHDIEDINSIIGSVQMN